MAPTRKLYRIGAIVEERGLYDTLMMLVANKVMNVEVLPVAPPEYEQAPPPDTTASKTANGADHAKVPVIEAVRALVGALKPRQRITTNEIVERTGAARQGVYQALHKMKQSKEVKGLGDGVYTRGPTDPPPPRASTNGAHPPEQRRKRSTGTSAFLLDLLKGAPGGTLTRNQILDAFVGDGRTSTHGAITSALSRIKGHLAKGSSAGSGYRLKA